MSAIEQPKFTDPKETKPGLNKILVKSVQYGAQAMILEKDVAITLRDGAKLFANVFRPEKDGVYPVVLSADVYGKDSIHMAQAAGMPGSATLGMYEASSFAAWEAPDPGFWVPNDYVVVKVALRGTSGSKGTISPLSWDEAKDFYDAIEWAGVQPWSSGAVGINGVSYLAMTAWRVGQLHPTHLKAMIPWEGISDMYREGVYHGGIPETNFWRRWIKQLVLRNPGAVTEDFTAMTAEHPLDDEFWEGRRGNLGIIDTPLYVGASWSTHGLHTRGTIEGFRQAASKHKWIEIHGRKEWESYYRREALERQLAFFDYFLKGIENDWQDTPRVRIEVREGFYKGLVRHEDEWPLARTEYTPLYLTGDGSLSASASDKDGAVSYDAASGSAQFVYRFTADTEVTGYMKLKLWVSTDAGEDMDIFVGVKKLDRRGKEVAMADFNHLENGIVARGWLRVSYRELDEKRSTPQQPWHKHSQLLKLKPGQIVPVEIEIWPSSTLFRSGESLQLTVQGMDIERKKMNPLPAIHGVMRYEHAETLNKGKHTIHLSGKYDSHLLIPIVPPK